MVGANNGPPAKALRTPRAAGAAGVISAVLLGTAMVLVRHALHTPPPSSTDYRKALRIALLLLPFGGVAFLWFMGALRDFIGGLEDRFFATAFLGAGLLYVAMLFVFGAAATAFQATGPSQGAALSSYGRNLALALLVEYAPRMAGVFTMTTTTIATRLGLFPRWLSVLGYLVGLVLLLLVSSLPRSEIAFPCWVLVVGVFLITHRVRNTGG